MFEQGNPDSARKDTNPKDAVGTRKAPMSVVSAPVIAEIGLGMLEGARKYGRHNYRVAGIRYSVYYDAAMRHLMAWWEGQDVDPDSGLSHITKALCTLVVLRDAMLSGKFTDDRPPRIFDDWSGLNAKAGEIIDRYPDPKEPFVEKDDSLVRGFSVLEQSGHVSSGPLTAKSMQEAYEREIGHKMHCAFICSRGECDCK